MPAQDCERLVEGFLVQPVNALSSLAFVLAGIAVAVVAQKSPSPRRLLSASFAVALVFVGVGSLAFHGPTGPPADWAHDASISTVLLLILITELGFWRGWDTRWVVGGWLPAAAAMGAVEGVWPSVADRLNASLALVAVIGVIGSRSPNHKPREQDRAARSAAIAFLVVGAIVMLLSRTGGPLCFPDSSLQGHALWHVLAASGLGLFARSVSTDPRWDWRASV
ncbi:MAG: ceramidase domain-containing protein [Acidimicrobiia bacterium]|nr:ceramidase domain-containing protein [Acidimicrobiia bacterium]